MNKSLYSLLHDLTIQKLPSTSVIKICLANIFIMIIDINCLFMRQYRLVHVFTTCIIKSSLQNFDLLYHVFKGCQKKAFKLLLFVVTTLQKGVLNS